MGENPLKIMNFFPFPLTCWQMNCSRIFAEFLCDKWWDQSEGAIRINQEFSRTRVVKHLIELDPVEILVWRILHSLFVPTSVRKHTRPCLVKLEARTDLVCQTETRDSQAQFLCPLGLAWMDGFCSIENNKEWKKRFQSRLFSVWILTQGSKSAGPSSLPFSTDGGP